MIGEFLLSIVFNIVESALSVLPAFDWNIKASFFQSALDMVRLAGYMLPMDTIGAIISIVFVLILWRIAISILKTIWDILPLA